MKTYWDFTDREQSEMTEETVRSFLDVELMTEGVIKPAPPQLKAVEACPVGPKAKYFAVHGKSKWGSDEDFGICFGTADEANAFLALNPMKSDYDYEVGSEFRYASPLVSMEIHVDELYSLDQINTFRSQLKNRKSAVEANTRENDRFKKESDAAEKITNGVWEDWFKKREHRYDLERVVKTFNEYVGLSSGDKKIAYGFLQKAHPVASINECREWFPDAIPTESDLNPPQCAEAVA
jgi:hypothetical protein